MSSATNGEPQKHFFLRSWISQIAALAAVVAIGFFTLSMVEQAPDPMQQNTLAAAHDVPPLILNDLILLEDEVTSLSWLLDEGNQITLASYLAQ